MDPFLRLPSKAMGQKDVLLDHFNKHLDYGNPKFGMMLLKFQQLWSKFLRAKPKF